MYVQYFTEVEGSRFIGQVHQKVLTYCGAPYELAGFGGA